MTVRRLTRFIDERSSGIVAAFVGPILLMVYVVSSTTLTLIEGILPLWSRLLLFLSLSLTTLVSGLIFSRKQSFFFFPSQLQQVTHPGFRSTCRKYIGNCGLLSLRELNESEKNNLWMRLGELFVHRISLMFT